MKKVAVVGVGQTKFGQLWDKGLVDLAVEAGVKALADAGVSQEDVQTLYSGCMSGGLFAKQEHIGCIFADRLGLKNIPATRVEAACASGGLALRQAYIDIASGMSDVAIVIGAEKMSDLNTFEVTDALSTASDYKNEAFFGTTFPGLYAMIARLHMHQFGTTEEQLAQISVKNHLNALKNEYAQFHKEVSVDDVMRSARIADPIKLLDSSPISDGAAALVLMSEQYAADVKKDPIWIAGSGHCVDTIALHDRVDITTFKATIKAAQQAYEQAGCGPQDIGLAEVHDCFTIAELLAVEDLGFVEKGGGGMFIEDGNTLIEGKIPINISGGLKAKGHPIGATGVAQAIEIVSVLRGDKRLNGIDEPELGLAHNVGGSGGTAIVHIFSR